MFVATTRIYGLTKETINSSLGFLEDLKGFEAVQVKDGAKLRVTVALLEKKVGGNSPISMIENLVKYTDNVVMMAERWGLEEVYHFTMVVSDVDHD